MSAVCQTPVPAKSVDTAAIVAIVVTVVTWASAFPAIRAGLGAFGPLELGALRFAVAAIPAALYLAVARPALPNWREFVRIAAVGAIAVSLYTVLLNIGELTVPAGAASFIVNTAPILTAILSIGLMGERFGMLAWTGTVLSFAGIGLIALGEGEGLSIGSGALAILGSAVCTATAAILQKPLFARHKPITVSAWMMLFGAAFLAPGLAAAVPQAAAAPAEALGAAIYLGLLPSFVAYGSWAIVLSRFPAGRATNFLYCVPPVATLIGFAWLGEVPSVPGAIGGLMALAGVVVVNVRR